MAVDLSALLSKKADEIEKPKPLPVGHYVWNVGAYKPVQSQKKGTPGIEFEVTPCEAKDDVDADLLAEVKDPFKKSKRLTFWLTEDSLFRLVEFMDKLGLETKGRELIEILPETQGCQFIAPIKQELMDSGDMVSKLNENSISAAE